MYKKFQANRFVKKFFWEYIPKNHPHASYLLPDKEFPKNTVISGNDLLKEISQFGRKKDRYKLEEFCYKIHKYSLPEDKPIFVFNTKGLDQIKTDQDFKLLKQPCKPAFDIYRSDLIKLEEICRQMGCKTLLSKDNTVWSKYFGIIRFLNFLFGFFFYHCIEAEMGFMVKRGFAESVTSFSGQALATVPTKIIVPHFNFKRKKRKQPKIVLQMVDIEQIMTDLKLNEYEFQQWCILLGCISENHRDYNTGVKRALNEVKDTDPMSNEENLMTYYYHYDSPIVHSTEFLKNKLYGDKIPELEMNRKVIKVRSVKS